MVTKVIRRIKDSCPVIKCLSSASLEAINRALLAMDPGRTPYTKGPVRSRITIPSNDISEGSEFEKIKRFMETPPGF